MAFYLIVEKTTGELISSTRELAKISSTLSPSFEIIVLAEPPDLNKVSWDKATKTYITPIKVIPPPFDKPSRDWVTEDIANALKKMSGY